MNGKWISLRSPKFESTVYREINGRERMNTVIADVARTTMKRARRGLFGNTGKLFGNNVSHSERKYVFHFIWVTYRTRRTWDPNVLHKRLYSATLDDFVSSSIEFALCVDLSPCDVEYSALH